MTSHNSDESSEAAKLAQMRKYLLARWNLLRDWNAPRLTSPCDSCKWWKPLCHHPESHFGWYPCYSKGLKYWEPKE